MSEQMVKVGTQAVRLSAIAAAKWEGDRLYVYFMGGRFTCFDREDAALVWAAVEQQSVDLRTGEVAK